MASKRRKDIRGILANPDLRRKLMIPTLQATQAREGIDTSREQAERAYYVVTEGDQAAFFDLEKFKGGKGQEEHREEMFVHALRGEESHQDTKGTKRIRFDVARRDFGAIEGSPLAFRRVGFVAHIFRESLQLDPGIANVKSGLMTVQSERILRWHWEIPIDRHSFQNGWSLIAKGGDFCRFYRDVDLLVDMGPRTLPLLEREGCLRNRNLYGREGLTWVPRTQRGFNIQYLPSATIFGKKGPIVIPENSEDLWWLLAILNSITVEYILQGLMSFGSYEVGVLQKLPIPRPKHEQAIHLHHMAQVIHDAKATWDEGNEISTRFQTPWLLNESYLGALGTLAVPKRLDRIGAHEATEEARIQKLYAELNDEVYRLYNIPDATRTIIEETLGERPPEVLWPQMEGKSVAQKRLEHVFRLLSYVVKRVVAADEDGIVPLMPAAGDSSLLERVHQELQVLFPQQDIGQIEVEIANELKQNVKGYRRTSGIGEWLENAFFEYHSALYKKRPILWHVASSQGTSRCAFGAICQYHKFDRNRLAKLRAQYLYDTIEGFRREAALAKKEGRTDDRLEWQAQLEEAQELDRRLQLIQEGHCEGPEGETRDYRILTPWKSEEQRPDGWEPDIDDGVKVNIAPLLKAGVLRVGGI